MKLETNENKTNEHVALNFETLKYDPSESSGNILHDNLCNPDLYFFNTNIQNLDTPYILPKEFQNFLDDALSGILSILHLNIRSIKKKLILKYKNNIEKTWEIIHETMGNEKCNQHRFSTKIVVDKESIININSIAEIFNKFFTEIGSNLANKINPTRKHFQEYLKEY